MPRRDIVSLNKKISAGKNIAEKAATVMNGLSTLTRKLNRPTTLNSGSTLSWSAQASATSPLTPGGRSNHIQKDEVCEGAVVFRMYHQYPFHSLTLFYFVVIARIDLLYLCQCLSYTDNVFTTYKIVISAAWCNNP